MSLTWSPDYAPVDGDFADVSLLLKGEGTNGSTTILDSSSNNLSVTVNGDAQISTAVVTPFSPTVPSDGVLAFDGNGDYLDFPSSANFAFGTGDFTVEFWINLNSTSVQIFFDSRSSGSAQDGFVINVGVGPFLQYYTNAATQIVDSEVFNKNTWVHCALARASNTTKLFKNGVTVGTLASDTFNFTNTNLRVGGRLPVTGLLLNGYISNLRITKGVARYTENFDVPTAPFPIYSPTTRAQA